MTLYLEDLSVGQTFRSESRVLTAEEIIRFARDNDPQYFHIDPGAAEASLFGGLVASGWQTAALSMRLLVEGPAPFAGGIVGMNAELSWPKPVRPGDSIRIEAEVTQISSSRSRPDRGIVSLRLTTFNQRDEPVQKLSARVLVFARADGKLR
jgi:acyl dehydratase